jgi:hypothetical protein
VGPVQDPHLVVHHRLNRDDLVRSRTCRHQSNHPAGRRLFVALLLVAVAVVMVVAEPFPKGDVLPTLAPNHGVDVGDLPALALLLVAALLAI